MVRTALPTMPSVSLIASSLRKIGDAPGRAGKLQNVHAVIGAVDDIDIAAIVDIDVVGLDHLGAVLLVAELGAALIAERRNRRDVIGGLAGVIGIANVDRAHAGVEMGKEHQPLVID